MNTFAGAVTKIQTTIIEPLIPIIFSLALVFFFWGMAMYILRAGDSTKAKEGAQMMTYALIGMFVMFSVWGILAIVSNTFDLNNSSLPFPQFRGNGGDNTPENFIQFGGTIEP